MQGRGPDGTGRPKAQWAEVLPQPSQTNALTPEREHKEQGQEMGQGTGEDAQERWQQEDFLVVFHLDNTVLDKRPFFYPLPGK